MNRILVPLDGTPQAASALPLAAAVASANGGSVVLLQVIEDSGLDRHETRARFAAAEAYLKGVSRELAANNVETASVVRCGPVAETIADAARDEGANLIIMATRGRSGLSRAIAGSVAQGVLGLTDQPLVLLKPGGKRVRRLRTMLVPMDGTAGGALALASATALARAAGARLVLLEVVPPFPMWLYAAAGGLAPNVSVDPDWEVDSLHAAERYVASLASRLRAGDIEAEARAMVGEVAPSIRSVANEVDADLVVMSTHALTGPTRTLIGSTADEVARTSRHPVLLIRRPGGVMDRLSQSADEAPDPATATFD